LGALRILHASSDFLPDARVEKSAWTARKLGHEVYFAGPGVRGYHLSSSPFAGVFQVGWDRSSRMGVPAAWRRVRKELASAVDTIKPEIVHAHNIFSAELAHNMHLPMIYDDHEYWSMMRKAELEGWPSDALYHPSRLPRYLVRRYGGWLWRRWESRVIPDAPTITVCEATADAHAARGARDVFVVPNVPCEKETGEIPPIRRIDPPLTAVAVGNDFTAPMRIRDSKQLLQIFASSSFGQLTVIGDPSLDSGNNVTSVKSMPHLRMLKELSNHHIGIIGWRPNWFHKYCNPNKAYEYMHAGLVPVVPSTLTPVLEMCNGFVKAFSNYEELAQILLTFVSNLDGVNETRLKIYTFSKEALLWEHYESRILEAYGKVS
jgi:hypothetical protein